MLNRICGVYSPVHPSVVKPDTLASMAASMAFDPMTMRLFDDHARGLAIVCEGRAPADGNWSADATAVVAVAGSLYPHEAENDAAEVKRRYEAGADDFPSSVDGAFSVAVWDPQAALLTLATDVFGASPLYYHYDPRSKGLFFASELRALLAQPGLDRSVDAAALSLYLRLGYVPPPWTMIRSVRKALPYEMLRLDASGNLTQTRYFDLASSETGAADLAYWAPRLKEQVVSAVSRIMAGKASTGVLLSGGVDSTVALAAMSELGARDVTALTLAYPDRGHGDETESAARVAQDAGVRHEVVTIRSSALTPDLVSMVFRRFDEPSHTFDRGLTQYFLAAAARDRGLELCLSGQLGENVVGDVPFQARLDKLDRFRLQTPGERLLVRIFTDRKSFFSTTDVLDFLGHGFDAIEPVREMAGVLPAGLDSGSDFQTYMNLAALLGSTGAVCMPGRVVSSLCGVEDRPAFADRQLLEFCNLIPDELRGGAAQTRGRALLRAAFGDRAPSLLNRAPKEAFPATPWTAADWFERLAVRQVERLSESDVLLDPIATRRALRKYEKRRARRDLTSIWLLFVLQTWYDMNLGGFDPFSEL